MPVFSFSQTSSNQIEDKPGRISLEKALEIAYRNNNELAAYKSKAEESLALIPPSFSIDRTSIYYSYDENNRAQNDYPIGVFGGEQRFDFPTVYFAQKQANIILAEMAQNTYEQKKKLLTRDVSKTYYRLNYLYKKLSKYQELDSIYSRYTKVAKIKNELGESSNLDFLYAQAREHEVRLMAEKLRYDIDIALSDLGALMQCDSSFTTLEISSDLLEIQPSQLEVDPGYAFFNNAIRQNNALVKVEKNNLYPDITLNYFNGTNSYAGASNYQGVMVGIGLPLFFGEQKAKIKAGKLSAQASADFAENYRIMYTNSMLSKVSELEKLKRPIEHYIEAGKNIANELQRSAVRAYDLGDIDFLKFVQSLDAAIEIELNYLEGVYKYNSLVLDLNYFTL